MFFFYDWFQTLVAPLCFGWFDEEDDDQPAVMVNGTSENTTSTSTSLLNCQTLDDVFSYFNDFYDYLDQTFNPFYEPPPATPPTLVTPLLNTTDLNSTSTTPAPA